MFQEKFRKFTHSIKLSCESYESRAALWYHWLMSSLLVCPKVITLDSFYSSLKTQQTAVNSYWKCVWQQSFALEYVCFIYNAEEKIKCTLWASKSFLKVLFLCKGSSINDDMAGGGRGYQWFCDDITKALVMKSVTMGGGGVKKYQILRDVIYGRPLNIS